jgi:CRISPR-associated endonuclease/helicase Cas3
MGGGLKMTETIYYAHSNDQDQMHWQKVIDHLTRTAEIASGFAADAGLADMAYVAGLMHDIGKYSDAFQRRIKGSPEKVDHTTAGAQEIKRLLGEGPRQKLIASLLAYCIAGHHGGLLDYGSSIDVETEHTLRARLKRVPEPYSAYAQEVDTFRLKTPPALPPIQLNRQARGFSLAFMTRMLYSALVDADFIETETFVNGKKPRGDTDSISVLTERFNQYLERFAHPQNPIHERRTQILQSCVASSAEKPGLFKLTVPTGGGKTYASMAFALNHALANGLKRVIYVIPYTSIIEQNAAHFKDSMNEGNVLEHHSNFDWDGLKNRVDEEMSDDNLQMKLKLASENWDIPVVVTTNVQFFESLFANRSSRCRKLHNLARSVIIFDEAQMLPRDYLRPCMYAVHELVKNYGATVVLCTATQPPLEQFLPGAYQAIELAPDPLGLYAFFKRVQIRDLGKLPDEDLLLRLNEQDQALCIVNTRRHARGLLDGLACEGRFHLSTLMCPAHRKKTLAEIRQRLVDKLTCRVISTQIMEAGIDVDFPVGYRALSGLDSIIQAGGRVNREGKADRADLFVFEPDSQFVKRTPVYIRQGAAVAQGILRRYAADPSSLEAIAAYYGELYGLQDKKAFDAKEVLGCFEKGTQSGEAVFEFQSAAEKFKIIENDTQAVIIRYNSDQAIIDDLLEKVRTAEFPRSYMRKLQPYTVNIYSQEFEALQASGAIDQYADTFFVLNDPDLYNDETGLSIPENQGGQAVFFDGF